MESQTFRLVTRSDFDGIVCAVLLKKKGLVGEDILFAHPKDMQDGKIEVTSNDIIANLPYAEGARMVFDHHLSETLRLETDLENLRDHLIIDPDAPSAAQVIYNHFGGASGFPDVSKEMIEAVNKADTAKFSERDVLEPKDWALLHFLMDPRTGLGRLHHFRISNYDLMLHLIDFCAEYSITEILEQADVKERVHVYFKYQQDFQEQLERCSQIHNDVLLIDLRNEDIIYPGNRFVAYALYPECNISIHALWGKERQNVVFATGHSIFNRTSRVNVGELMLAYGGGGHEGAGTCQIDEDQAETVLQELIRKINA